MTRPAVGARTPRRFRPAAAVVAAVLGLAVVTGCATEATPDPGRVTDDMVLHGATVGPDGIGPFTVEQATSAEVEPWHVSQGGEPFLVAGQTENCSLATDGATGLALVLDPDRTVLAFVVGSPSIRTAEGIGVGDDVDELTQAYDPATVLVTSETSQTGGPMYGVDDEPDGDLVRGDRLLAFDTSIDGVITRVRAGAWPWVTYLDHCSDLSTRPDAVGWPLTRER